MEFDALFAGSDIDDVEMLPAETDTQHVFFPGSSYNSLIYLNEAAGKMFYRLSHHPSIPLIWDFP